jgi:hypothetical protein
MALEDFELEHKATSVASNGHIIARVDITPPSNYENVLNLGYELRQRFDTIYEYLFVERQFEPDLKFLEENHLKTSNAYKERYEKKLVDVNPLFEIDCPQYELIDVGGGMKIKMEYEPEIILYDDYWKKSVLSSKEGYSVKEWNELMEESRRVMGDEDFYKLLSEEDIKK